MLHCGKKKRQNKDHVLSELAKRMAKVSEVGTPSVASAKAFQTQLRSEPTLG